MQAETPDIRERFATALGSAPVLLGDLRNLSTADRQWYRKNIGWFKTVRDRWPINESFFPLGSWLQPSASKWDGFARLAHSGDGIVVLFRNRSSTATAHVELPLVPVGRFGLRSVVTGKDLGTFTKPDFARGVDIAWQSSETVEILEMSAAGEPK